MSAGFILQPNTVMTFGLLLLFGVMGDIMGALFKTIGAIVAACALSSLFIIL